jgi:tRNA (mo5U34)-methyltransferase
VTGSDLEQRVAGSRWFHAIDFGDFASSGRFPIGEPQNVTLYGVMDLLQGIDVRDRDVLDVGTVDGLTSFGLAHLGARVVATDSFFRDTFILARDALDVDVEYVPNLQLKDSVARFGRGAFDLIICAGVIYHMLNPASAFFVCRQLVRENGLVIFESAYEPRSNEAAIFVNSEAEIMHEQHTYSVPTKRAITGLMRLACFDVLAVRTMASPQRIAVLGRAVAPDQVVDRSKLTQRIHEIDFCDFEFRIRDHLPSPATSTITYTGGRDERALEPRSHIPNFPYHPPPERRAVGTTVFG